MSRLFWIAAGAAAGVLVVRKLQKTAEQLTPQGLARSFTLALEDLADAVRDFADEVRAGMSEREIELREALGLGETGDAGNETGTGTSPASPVARATAGPVTASDTTPGKRPH